jgi:hypothetical protein
MVMTRNTRIVNAGQNSVHGRRIRMEDTTRLNPYANLTRRRLRNRSLDQIQHARMRNFHRSIGSVHTERALPLGLGAGY